MKIKDLKKLIENLPDDMEVVTSAFDHELRPIDSGYSRKTYQMVKDGELRERYLEYGSDGPYASFTHPTQVFVVD